MNDPGADRCYHCSEPLGKAAMDLSSQGDSRMFCCAGCAAAARFIDEAGLADYYRLRSEHPGRAADTDFSVWDTPQMLETQSVACEGGREITVLSDGMRCAACAWLIDRSLSREAGVERVQANAVTGRIRIRWNPAIQPLSKLLKRIAMLGYPVSLSPGIEHEERRLRASRLAMLRIGIAALASVQAMMFAEALYLDFDRAMPEATRDFFRWLTLLVSTPVVFFSGWPFISGMLREWRARSLGMDTLIASSVLTAYAASLIETVRGGPHVWFDAAVMFVFFLLVARSLDQFARFRANAQVERLARASPQWATRIEPDQRRIAVPLTDLNIGDRIEVAAGGSLPADGILLTEGEFDESLLTGESRAQHRAAGETVLAGSQCLMRPVQIRVEKLGQQTWISTLVRAVEEAQSQRPGVARKADRIASWFVSGLLACAVLTYFAWLSLQPERAFEVFLAVLVVSCPCALSLAVPTALVAAHAALARAGLLVTQPDALHTLARMDHLMLDKTGTLTTGQPRILTSRVHADLSLQQSLAMAAALEQAAGHPLAMAFSAHQNAAVRAEDVKVHPGLGVEGIVDGHSVRIGQAPFACGGADDADLWLSIDGRAVASFRCQDASRADAQAACAALRGRGIALSLASGDATHAVVAMAEHCGIEDWRARQQPDAKRAWLQTLQQQGKVVGMMGDGINDAPVLAAAHVSIAMGSGAALAHRSAQIVLLHGRLAALAEGIAIARRSEAVLRQNLFWAIAYNLLALPFAAAGMVTPLQAALGMTASSLLVTLNALRIQTAGKRDRPVANPSGSRSVDMQQAAA